MHGFVLIYSIVPENFIAMTDNDGQEKTLREEQKDLFRELSKEQTEAEEALENDQEQAAKAKTQDESDE